MNYQHLLYFRTVAALGGITPAAQRLRLTPPTLSAQIRSLEDAFGVPLFERSARGMSLTDEGKIAASYAERIFTLGAELERTLRVGPARVVRLGVEASIVASTVRPLIGRLAGSASGDRVVCTFGSHDALVQALKALELDVVLTRAPLSEDTVPDLVSRLVLETAVGFFANAEITKALRSRFPASLQDVSFIAPPRSSLSTSIERWLARAGVRLATNIELGDASIAAALAADGVGIVAAPLSAEVELSKRYELELIGVADGVRAHIYAVGSIQKLDPLMPDLLGAQDTDEDDDIGPASSSASREDIELAVAEGRAT
ncbi:MAG TPA: LysR family transcriptional regulator [Labilithrix sp.]|nr:LysR family transcriptional regulator [Labilithrix sp.]